MCIIFSCLVFVCLLIYCIEISTMSSSEPSPRERFFSVSRHSSIYLWGGWNYGRVDDLDCLHEFNFVSGTWTKHQLQGRHPPGLYGGGCARIDDYMYLYGGYDEEGQKTGSLYKLNLTNWTWQEMSPPSASGSPGVKSGCSMMDYNNMLLVHGGWGTRTRPTNDLHIFDIATGECTLS